MRNYSIFRIMIYLKIIHNFSCTIHIIRYIWELIRLMKHVELLQFKISLCYIMMNFKHKSSMLFHLFQTFLKQHSNF